jgi:hypothetical protein
MKRSLLTLALLLAAVSADAAPSASASASNAPAPPAKALEIDAPGSDVTPLPKPADWGQGHPVSLLRSPKPCKATRLHEWLRVVCHPLVTYGIALVSGDRKDVYFWINQQHFASDQERDNAWWMGELDSKKWSAEVIFPLRRGDRRLIQITGSSGESIGYGDSSPVRFFLSEHWLDDETGPVVSID